MLSPYCIGMLPCPLCHATSVYFEIGHKNDGASNQTMNQTTMTCSENPVLTRSVTKPQATLTMQSWEHSTRIDAYLCSPPLPVPVFLF